MNFSLNSIAMETMESLIAVLSHLKEMGWDHEFKVTETNKLELNGRSYETEDIELVQTYRFEGDTDPSEQAIIYIIKTPDQMHGYSIDSYGIYSNHNNDAYANFISNLEQHLPSNKY